MNPADHHVATICDDFHSEQVHVECSCGWVGENVPNERGPLARHSAMAGWAAHVHVANGLAVEGDDETEVVPHP